ncbi:MAG: DNA primase DnaG [Candidatus Micrarchaeaceae archaeon]
MAKTYIDIVKYMIEAKFEINGLVDKPDIIGAVFGQTEGLLGGNLDLRELQKNGKIGRIEIEQTATNNKTYGKLFLPSSLNRVETCILAAAVESVDRVGPFETEFKIEKVEDTRDEKRKKIIMRAKELVKMLISTEIPDSREISDLVETDVKASTITTYGPENLPAGPEVGKSDEVLVVEGRADVLNLLRNDISNAIAIGGAAGIIPKSVIELCAIKDATLFVDGDRGGEMIIKEFLEQADVDYIARAPDGKEVEELTRKEIIKSLRNRIPIEQFLQQNNKYKEFKKQGQQKQAQHAKYDELEGKQEHQDFIGIEEQSDYASEVLSPSKISENLMASSQRSEQKAPAKQVKNPSDEDNEQPQQNDVSSDGIPLIDLGTTSPASPGLPEKSFLASLEELHNTLRGRLYDSDGKLLSEVPIRELMQVIQDAKHVSVIVFDGIITQRLIELAFSKGVKQIYGIRSSQISKSHPNLYIYTSEKAQAR